MIHKGTITELDVDLNDTDYQIREAAITSERIAIDWTEDGEPFHLVATSRDGVRYRRNYGWPKPNPDWKIELTRYNAADKSVLLLAQWFQTDNGNEGSSLIRLMPQNRK